MAAPGSSATRPGSPTTSAGALESCPWAANALAQPEAVRPIDSELSVANGRLRLEMRPFSAARVRVPAAGERKRGAR